MDHAQAQADEADDQVEALRSQLADYQQALDAQQTRALQYQQAIAALEKAKQLCGLPHLDLHNAIHYPVSKLLLLCLSYFFHILFLGAYRSH